MGLGLDRMRTHGNTLGFGSIEHLKIINICDIFACSTVHIVIGSAVAFLFRWRKGSQVYLRYDMPRICSSFMCAAHGSCRSRG
jgi:hypothetical protein